MPIKKIEMRRCVSCREIKHKFEFLRVVKTPEGNFILDFSGKAQGHGAYICKSQKCAAENFKRRKMDKSFKSKLPADIYNEICMAVDNLNSSTF